MTTLPDPIRQALDKRLMRRPGWPRVASPAFRQLLRAWAGWRRGAIVPNRDDMNLAESPKHADRLFLPLRDANGAGYGLLSMSEYRFVPPSGDAVDGVPQDMVSVYACAPLQETLPD